MTKKYSMDMWSIRTLGPKGGKTTTHKMLVTVVNTNGVTAKYIYEFDNIDNLYNKKSEVINKIPLKSKLPKVNDYTMVNAWYLMPNHYNKEEDLFFNNKYIDELCYTDWIENYTNRKWVIQKNKFATKMQKVLQVT